MKKYTIQKDGTIVLEPPTKQNGQGENNNIIAICLIIFTIVVLILLFLGAGGLLISPFGIFIDIILLFLIYSFTKKLFR